MPNVILYPPSILDEIVLYPFNVIHPLPPTAMVASYSTNPQDKNKHLIRLTWTPALNQPDVASYNIYRNGAKLANVPVTASPLEYLDINSGGDVDFFTYYMTAVDVLGNEGSVSDSICNFSQKVNRFIDYLRRSLKDNPPDPRVQRWSDDDLWLALKMALSRVNAIPMLTAFNFDTAPDDLFNYILVAARIAAVRSQQTLEAAKEFNMGVGGTSISISRTAIYGGMISAEEQAWQKEIENIKRWFTMRTVFGEGIVTSPLPFRIRTFAPRQFRVR
jgi:hypothetical protein